MKTGHQIPKNLGAKIRALTIWDHYRSSKKCQMKICLYWILYGVDHLNIQFFVVFQKYTSLSVYFWNTLQSTNY